MGALLRLRYAIPCMALMFVLVAPAQARAQSSITGTVRDASGGVLPGVTVEAASPVLIEKVRTSVTDGTGQYRIVDLRPGTYTVTFTLTGFSPVKREGYILQAEFVATLNAELKVGGIEETITVSGESPVVDVQTTKQQRTLDLDMLQAVPTARGYAAVMLLIPSMVQSGGGNPNVQLSPGMIVFGGRGGRGNEGQSQIDGLGTGAAINGGGVSGYGQLETAQEVVMTTAGGLGEAEQGGPIVNFIPKSGGNSFQNHFYSSGMSGWMQSSNFTQALKDAGMLTPQKTLYLVEASLSNGGPLTKDRLWFFYNTRYSASGNSLPGIFYNLNAGNPNAWTYVPDKSRDVSNSQAGSINPTLRLTAQVSPRHKLNLYWDPSSYRLSDRPAIGGITGPTAGAPETATVSGGTGWKGTYSRMETARWTSTMTARLLLEAGVSAYQQNWNGRERPDNDRTLIPVTEQCTAGCPTNGNIQGLVYRGQTWNADFMEPIRWNASATYVTGAHSMKAGYVGAFYWDTRNPNGNIYDLSYRFNNGVPNQLTEFLFPYRTDTRVRMNALYLQDTWTRGRFTYQAALRYDHAWSYYPAQQLGPTRFLPNPLLFPETQGVLGYNDIDPRFGLAYDVFGNGKTAIKFNVGRYLEMAVAGNGNYSALLPSSRIPTSVTRSWSDTFYPAGDPRRNNFAPDCDLQNPLQNGECGQISNLNFAIPNAPPSLSYDPAILQGWGTRPSDWIIGVTVQHELFPRMSVSVGYTRRWLQNFTITDNQSVTAADFTPFSITAPLDPRLPGGGGYTVSGLYDVVPTKAGQINNLSTYASNYGSISQMYNGVDVNVIARLRNGVQFQGGLSSGARATDYCSVRAVLPEMTGAFSTGSEVPAFNPVNPYCNFSPGVTARYTGTATYTIPRIDVLFSGVITSSPGVPLAANWTIASADVAKTLGRPLSGNVPNITVNLLSPGQMFSDRVNELDLRLGKTLRFGRTRLNAAVDLLNALNLSTIIVPNQAFIPNGAWLTPTGTQTPVMTARTAKFTVQYDF
jgi:carboxypeptidase family protein